MVEISLNPCIPSAFKSGQRSINFAFMHFLFCRCVPRVPLKIYQYIDIRNYINLEKRLFSQVKVDELNIRDKKHGEREKRV